MIIHCVRGLYGSGKTYRQREAYLNQPEKSAFVSKDDIRRSLFPNTSYQNANLFLIEEIRDGIIKGLIGRVNHIYVDESFILFEDFERFYRTLPEGTEVKLLDLTPISIDTCIRNIMYRQSIGEDSPEIEDVLRMNDFFCADRYKFLYANLPNFTMSYLDSREAQVFNHAVRWNLLERSK